MSKHSLTIKVAESTDRKVRDRYRKKGDIESMFETAVCYCIESGVVLNVTSKPRGRGANGQQLVNVFVSLSEEVWAKFATYKSQHGGSYGAILEAMFLCWDEASPGN